MAGHPRPAPDKSSLPRAGRPLARSLAQRFPGIHLLRINQCAKLITASRSRRNEGCRGRGGVRREGGERGRGRGHGPTRTRGCAAAGTIVTQSSRVRSVNRVIFDLRSLSLFFSFSHFDFTLYSSPTDIPRGHEILPPSLALFVFVRDFVRLLQMDVRLCLWRSLFASLSGPAASSL